MLTGAPPLHEAWLGAIEATLREGHVVSPRAQPVAERVGVTVRFDGSAPLLLSPTRGLNYRFAVAEFLWIAAGLDAVAPLARYNSRMRAYSDDGTTLSGAYGPRLASQWDYVVGCLRQDPHSRQAVATVWTPRPGPSKDVPCTVAAQFLSRGGRLHGLWTMRSSDLWLGLPYDAFSFARLTACVAGELGLPVGEVQLAAGSSHLYRQHWGAAEELLLRRDGGSLAVRELTGFPPTGARRLLEDGRRAREFHSWYAPPWDAYAEALEAPTSERALAALARGALREAA